jgi:hypothetical protein|tara:strand:- start:489 stop:824 length:336 start_codon:yes stop_codon:yes gene_type:complete
MKYRTIENIKLPFGIWAIALYPFIICRGKLQKEIRNHEVIHLRQQLELLVIGFYTLYVLFWIVGLFKRKSIYDAYRSIPFEKEAYDNASNFDYLSNRRLFSWINEIEKGYP